MDLRTKEGRREQGQRIQRAVERAGLSIEELAGRIGCSRALIYQYLSGSTLAQPDRLQQIAFECGVPLTFFYGGGPIPEGGENDREPAKEARPDVAARLSESLRALQELADAQEGPPDYRALASTCERILSLASQIGDRTLQARAHRRLGNALLRSADYPRASDALRRAVALAQEAGDGSQETAARQSLGNALLQMGRAREAGEQFSLIARGDDFHGRWQGTLSLGCLHEMHGEYREAMQRFDAAAALLEEAEASGTILSREAAAGLLYVNANRANVYLDGGDFAGARPLAEKCLSDAEALGMADQHLEARFNLAFCDLHVGRWAQAHRGLSTMLQLARFVGDQGRETMARAWLGILLAQAGDFDAAISLGKDALALALQRGDRRAELYAQLALADAYTGAGGRDSEVRYHTGQALAITTALRLDRSEAECRLRLARLSVQVGEWAEARDAASRALAVARRLGARHLEALALCWLAEAELSGEEETARAQTPSNAGAALATAEEIGLVEARWRAHDLLARSQSDPAEAKAHARAAVSILDSLRVELGEAGLSDALLENADFLAPYERMARLLASDRQEEAAAFVEQVGWPPLTARLEADADAA